MKTLSIPHQLFPSASARQCRSRRWVCNVMAAALVLPGFAAAQVYVDWTAPSRGVSIAVDAQDNSFIVDYEYALGAEMSVTKRDVDGNLLWVASVNQTDNTKWERASWIGVDSQGAALVCGTLMSGYSNPVEAASLLLKFAADGTPQYRIVYENGFDGSFTKKLLIDEADNVYVLGMGSSSSGFVAKVKKFAPDGTPLWTYFDSQGIGMPTNFKFAPNGDMVIAARAIFGSINGYARVDRQGNEQWSLPGVQSLTIGDAASDAFGNTYVVHGEYVSNGGTTIKKLNSSGDLLWERSHPGAGFRIEVGTDNRAVVSGFPNSGTAGAAFFKIDEDGGLLWSNMDADGNLSLLLHAQMLLDSANNAYLAASTLFEMAVCKVNSDGTSAWTATTSGSGAWALALGYRPNTLFVVGGTTARLLDTVGTPYCVANANSTGTVAELGATGSSSATLGNLQLTAAFVPNQNGIFFHGPTPSQTPFGNGFLCTSGSITRGAVSVAQANIAHYAYDNTDSQHSLGNFVGTTRHFQYWFRDPAAGGAFFNTSNGMSIAILP